MHKHMIELQRQQLQLLLKWLNIIDECDHKIQQGIEVAYYKACKTEAAEGYSESMTTLMNVVINLAV